jgi:hypothetical protein
MSWLLPTGLVAPSKGWRRSMASITPRSCGISTVGAWWTGGVVAVDHGYFLWEVAHPVSVTSLQRMGPCALEAGVLRFARRMGAADHLA